MINILDFDIEEMRNWLKQNGQNSFRASQIMDWIYKNNIFDFEKMKNIPKKLRTSLKENFYIEVPETVGMYESKEKDTFKYLYRYNDGNVIETVVMSYNRGNSICVSTQVGCRMGCTFCASTINGMVRNLTPGEIIGQILAAQMHFERKISNVVLMGSGEPLDNYDNVVKFISIVNSDYSLNIGQRHITLSTCGLVPEIIKLANRKLQITLAISLHSPEDLLRKQMMPIANKYAISEIIDACKYYIKTTGRRVSFEYALVNGVNDSSQHALKVAMLLKGMICHVNLIPVNQVKEKRFEKSSKNSIEKFLHILSQNGIETTIRKEMGSDINAACGQLRRKYLESKKEVEGV
jgi:23S rRNA (adenine2503-C2)-methyltransferase